MGQTLENGVYLPSEGERNCYAGLKTNWEILDQKVADVTALQQAVAGALHREIVESLPTTDIDPNTIYMILSGTSATENVYNEFMYVNNAWELIGTSATDLTNYYTKGDVDGLLLLKANASDLTSHTGDTTIHVTASDKTKWNNQTYVFRYSSTALTPSSTNSNTLLDNTDNLKVGDKVIDSSGVLFSITAIDTANSTFTIGTALIDLAQDSDVVHKSGNETVAGDKVWIGTNTFQQNVTYQKTNFYHQVANPSYILKDTELEKGSLATTHASYPGLWHDKNSAILGYVRFVEYSSGRQTAEIRVSNLIKNGALDPTGSEVNCGVQLELQPSGEKSLIPEQNNDINLGTSTNKWKSFNGITPSSLSLPSTTGVVDISSYITDLTGTANTYTVLVNGYIQFDVTGSSVEIDVTNGLSQKWIMTDPKGFIPVVSGASVSIKVVGTAINNFKFIPCQGNV